MSENSNHHAESGHNDGEASLMRDKVFCTMLGGQQTILK